MSLSSLDNPLERLASLPNVMNWRGLWDNTTQYFRNDVVISPVDSAAYIALNLSTLGGGDPSTALPSEWLILSPGVGGITSVTAGAGISITGTPTIPQINNTGVTSLVAGTGITNVGTATDPELRNTGLLSLNVGTGLNSTGGQTPILTNTGVLSITTTPSSGISITGSSNAPTITNTGILSVTTPGSSGILIAGTAQNPQIFNDGVLSVGAGAGIAIGGTAQNPTITLTATVSPPIISQFQTSTFGSIAPATTGGAVCLVQPTSVLYDHLLNGSPDPNGLWVLDMTNVCFYVTAPAGGTNSLTVGIEDISTLGGPYTYTGVPGTGTIQLDGNPPQFFSMGKFYLDVASARATGLRELNQILVSNDTGGTLTNTSWGGVIASYYPNGIQ